MISIQYNLHQKVYLSEIAKTHTLRCDAKQFDDNFALIEDIYKSGDYFFLGELLPFPLIKGAQPNYIDDADGVPVINTLSIQKLAISIDDCRIISDEDYDALPDQKKLKKGDVLLTMDGGTSIGKSVVFDMDGKFTIDSHVAILRPEGITPMALCYLLASPFGQIQFNKAESGASGQTSVTEEDLRRFLFPKKLLQTIESLSIDLDKKRQEIAKKRKEIDKEEENAWKQFVSAYLGK